MNVRELVNKFSPRDNKQTIDVIFDPDGALILFRSFEINFTDKHILCYIPAELINMIEHEYNYKRGSKEWTSVIANLPVFTDEETGCYRAYFQPLYILSFDKEEPGLVAMQPNFIDGDYD